MNTVIGKIGLDECISLGDAYLSNFWFKVGKLIEGSFSSSIDDFRIEVLDTVSGKEINVLSNAGDSVKDTVNGHLYIMAYRKDREESYLDAVSGYPKLDSLVVQNKFYTNIDGVEYVICVQVYERSKTIKSKVNVLQHLLDDDNDDIELVLEESVELEIEYEGFKKPKISIKEHENSGHIVIEVDPVYGNYIDFCSLSFLFIRKEDKEKFHEDIISIAENDYDSTFITQAFTREGEDFIGYFLINED